MKCDSVRFLRCVYDPASPNGIGRVDFERPVYDIYIDGGLCVIVYAGRRYLYPVSGVAWSIESDPEAESSVVRRVRRA